jgi:hypothetical protein
MFTSNSLLLLLPLIFTLNPKNTQVIIIQVLQELIWINGALVFA